MIYIVLYFNLWSYVYRVWSPKSSNGAIINLEAGLFMIKYNVTIRQITFVLM